MIIPNVCLSQSDNFQVDFKSRMAEPAPEVRGNIAHIYFYMQEKYGMQISKKQMQLFLAWDSQGPIDNWERENLARIAVIEASE